MFSAAAMSGNQRCLCSSDPHSAMEPVASPLWTPWKVAIEGSTRDISMATNPTSIGLAPEYGRSAMPRRLYVGRISKGNRARVKASLMIGGDLLAHEVADAVQGLELIVGEH